MLTLHEVFRLYHIVRLTLIFIVLQVCNNVYSLFTATQTLNSSLFTGP